ncbi:CHAT domain-containing protein [Armatimonadetes bacterium GXS]|nr:CHAT domain-containing protein [Armatimonadetes bacterium GXS]
MRRSWLALTAMVFVTLWLSALIGNAQQEMNTPLQPAQDAPAPEPQPELKPLLENARSLLNDKKWDEALQKVEELLQQATEKSDKVGLVYAHRLKAQALMGQGKWQEAWAQWEQVQKLWEEVGDGAFVVEALLGQAQCWLKSDPKQAEALVEVAVARAEKESRRPVAAALALVRFCRAVAAVSPALAQRAGEVGLTLLLHYSPQSEDTAAALSALGVASYYQQDLARAQEYFERALTIRESLDPQSSLTASMLHNLGTVCHTRGNLEQAQRYYERALKIHEQHNPESPLTADTLHNLGTVFHDRGDLEQAQRYYERALTIRSRIDPNSLDTASTLNNLGNLFYGQGDLEQAQKYLEAALKVFEQADPSSWEIASTLNNLGNVAYARRNLAQAQHYYKRALKIREQISPNSSHTAVTLNNLGNVSYERRDWAQAQRYYERALEIFERINPYSWETAGILQNLGDIFRESGALSQAQSYYERAARVYEVLRFQIVNPEDRALFTEVHLDVYYGLATIHLHQKRPAQAAEALERARARELTDALYKRQLQLPNAPQALQKLLQQQQALEAERYALHNKLRQSDPSDKEALRALNERLFDLTNQQDKIDARIRNEFPQYAQLLAPTPPRIQTIQQGLDNGVVMLYYALLPKELLIVAVSRQQVQGYRVPVKQEQLENAVQEFRRIISRPPLMRTASERRTLVRLGRQLYDWLVKPAAASLQGAKRVALCPEGVLNLLPWGALIVSTDKNGKPTYWVERMALHLTPSAGVYRQARGVKPASGGVMVAAVSEYGGFQQASAREVEALLRRSGTTLSNLPNVKAEVGRIQQVFRKGVRVAQEQAATPERVRVLAQGARVVHFSCHARADNADPYGSALLLAPAGRDEGLLEAAEVLGSWRLAADIVMLSACETGVGVLRRYEGMYGLARAFLFAGSRSVGASLWAVSDASTAALMGAFYAHYAKGQPKDEALRLAQLGLLRSKQYSDPYYWSAFVLIGDYR